MMVANSICLSTNVQVRLVDDLLLIRFAMFGRFGPFGASIPIN